MTGIGMLVMPNEATGLSLGGVWTLHSAGQDYAIKALLAEGWEPLAADDGGFLYDDRTTRKGDRVISLFAHDRIISEPTIEEDQHAIHTFAVAYGLMLAREVDA